MMKRFILSILFVFLLAFAVASANGSLEISTASAPSGAPGDTVSYTVILDNTGSTDISSVSMASSTLSNGSSTISAPSISSVSTLTSSTDQSVSFSISIPSVPAGVYTGTLTATDTSNSANTDSISYTLTVTSKDAFSMSETSIPFVIQDGDSASDTFSITNTGSTTLSSWVINFTSDDGDLGKLLDSDDDEIGISLSSPSSSLAPGSSMTITVSADPDSNIDFGTYSGTIALSAVGSSSVGSSLPLSVEISPDICDDGKQGSDFNIDIRNPDSGDNFLPGDIIPMEVKVENQANDDLDVDLEVTLYDTDTGNKEEVVKEEGSIDQDETETFSFDFEIPTDIDENDHYELFVQVHEQGNEDDSCDFESVDIDIDRNDKDAAITELSISPELGLVCGDSYRLSIYVDSTGNDNLDGAYLTVFDADLGVDETSASFSLGDYNDADNEEKVSYDFVIPTDIQVGEHYLEAILYDENGNSLDSELALVDVTSCSPEDTAGDVQFSVSPDYDVQGKDLTLGLLIDNTGDGDHTISVSAEDVSWATLAGTEYLPLLAAGDEAHAYLYLSLDDTTVGKHDMEITVTDELGNAVSQIVTVDFGEAPVAQEDSFFAGINDWFRERASGSFWIVVDIILVILGLVFLRMLFSKK